MSFNSIVLFGVNISLIVFALITLKFSPQIKIFNVNTVPQVLAVLIYSGVILSVLDIDTGSEGLSRSLAVLPNYLYWCLLTVLTVNLRYKILWSKMAVAVAFGLMLTLIFYQFGDFDFLDLLKNNSPNSYSFILVCFSAITVKAIQEKYGMFYALILMAIILLSLIDIERRAGFVLVLLSCTAALSIKQAKMQYLLTPLIIACVMFIAFQLPVVESMLEQASPRIYELLYETENVAATDQSYLTRKLMVERGLSSFEEHPITGVGINNLGLLEFEDEGAFEGAEIVMGKAEGRKFSAHNSYIFLLVEGGLGLIVPFLLLLAYNVMNFVRKFNARTPLENAFYWSFIAMIIHLYMISEIVNVYAWFLLAAVSSLSIKYESYHYMVQLDKIMRKQQA